LIFTESKLKGAFIIELDKHVDSRGFFARSWDRLEFEEHGLSTKINQCNVSLNKTKGTLRGMHYQKSYNIEDESKIVKCTKGEIFDVILDLRPSSGTFKDWLGISLSEDNHKMIYIPNGFAHGFLTMRDNTEVFYHMAQFYEPEYSQGIRWDDNSFGIIWPMTPKIISEKDRDYEDFAYQQSTIYGITP